LGQTERPGFRAEKEVLRHKVLYPIRLYRM
jgi:hypothetical protein